MTAAAVEVRELSVRHGKSEIVRALTTSVASREWVSLIGPNGAGKTTTLKALAGLVPFTGEVLVEGDTLARRSRREIARTIALVPQSPHVSSELTVAEYVLLGRIPHVGYFGGESRADRLASERALARLSLRRFTGRLLGSLSGGELQRVVLARALAQEAPVLLLDEPTSALDLGRQQQALDLVDGLRREDGLTVISAMHDLSLASQYADRLLLLDSGRLVEQGPAATVLSEERINAMYGASVEVFQRNGHVVVLPRRSEAACAH